MQTRKLCSVLPASYRSNVVFLRNVAVNAATVNEEQDVKVEGRPWQEVPGPKSLPLIGQLYHFLPGGLFYKTTNQEFTRKALELYGPIVRLNGMPGMPPMIMLFDPQCAEQVLRGENWLPHRPGFQSLEYFRHYYKNNNTITNEPTGLVTDHGEPWKQFRSTVNPILLQPKTIKLYTSALEEVANDMIQRLTKHFLDKAKEDLKNKKKTDDEKGVLEKLLDIDEKVAHIMASDMLFAGVDTTANTIMYNLYLLAVNPKKQEKLREEVMSQNDKKPYLKACIKESLRLLPVVSGNMRMSSKEYNLRGYKIPKGTHITFIHQDMAQLEEHYIKPKEYIPERWLVPKDDPLYYGNAHPFAYSPFGFGARMCIGRRIAELEVQTFLAKLIQNFKVEWVGPPLNVKQTSLNYAAPPYNFVLKDV
ncbi:cytochrome P450 CYP12A2-like isoform X2 [Plodia interpunctella]|uniref:cytochrome P450 CYP12A2-like isoform X2 n=1 Tax=Plodia interpunctella TaxID=58824 RepID=UPI0023683985|nr:cytochrome P450 CYP12A2-like isoform X2 [Plodia interpunctella]